MSNTEKTPVVFRIGEETKPVVQNDKNYKDSLFAEQIEKGLSLIYEAADRCKRNADRGDYHYRFSDVFDNNIIAFIGERGSGKSSCMYSVVNVLSKEKEKAGDFVFLDTLDPSFFDDNHNILQLIIGKMYGQFRKDMDRLAGEEDYKIHEVVKKFQDVKSHLKFLEDKPEYVEDNELEELSQLSAGVELRSSLLRLIDNYLQMLNAKMLIVTIDDIDLNTEQAYDMAEQIRKYLILPNVVILLAAKLDQFTDVVRLKLTKQYSSLLSKERLADDAITEMADRYVKKLLPLENRIYMPLNEVYIERPLIIERGDEKSAPYKSIKMAVPELIFQKCRYLFYNTRGTTSQIVPRNLRDLRLLVSMLYRMPDNKENNKNIFKKYFFNDWLNVLSNTSKGIAQRLLAVDEPTQLNKSVIYELKKQYKLSGDSTNEEVEGWSVILQDNTMNYNLSIGDAFAVMDYVRRVNADADTQRLVFFIKSLYSIRLYEYYDQQTDYIDTHDQAADPVEEKKKEELPNRRDDFLENISSYRKLIGGSFFNIGGRTLLPPERKDNDAFDGVSRESIVINKKTLQEKIKKIKEAFATIAEKTSDELGPLTDDLKAVEFMMLTISHHYLRKEVNKDVEQKDRSYRERMEAYYDRSLADVQNVRFDITTPFFTLLDVRHAYGRFDDEIFDIARKWDYKRPEEVAEGAEQETFKSLYVEMLEMSDKGIGRKPEHDLLARAGIRNAEVADDLFEHLKSYRDKYKKGAKEIIGILADFYTHISEYEIATYDKDEEAAENENERYYKIKYLPFGCIAKYLEDTNNEMLTKTFDIKKTKREIRQISGGNVVAVVPEFEYIDHDMTRDEIWQQLEQHIPGIAEGDYHDKLYHQYFKTASVYSRDLIVSRLQDLSRKQAWSILRGAIEPAAVIEPAPAQPAQSEPTAE